MSKPKILMTMGDAAGIGPEICLKAASNESVRRNYIPIIIGDIEQLRTINHKLQIINLNECVNNNDIDSSDNIIHVINVRFPPNYKVKFGNPDKITGKYSFLYLKKAVELIEKNFCKKLVTAPISKKAWREADIKYLAHTEALADMTNTKKYAMIFANDKAKVVLATRHVPIKDLCKYFTKKNLEDAIDIGAQFLKILKLQKKRIGICGLNPHAGEDGYNGSEELKIIKPVLRYKKYSDINFFGPVSCDAVFEKAKIGEIDIIIAAYHDQGILPLKVMDYYGSVNITVGLPFIRVSPGHGTAFDIAGKNIAKPDAMINAILWAQAL